MMDDVDTQAVEDLRIFLAWVVDALEFLPLSESSKRVVELLIKVERVTTEKLQEQKEEN